MRLPRTLQAAALAARLCLKDHVGDRAAALSFASLMSMLPLLLLALASLDALGFSEPTRRLVEKRLFDALLPQAHQALSASLDRSLEVLSSRSRTLGVTGVVLLVLAASQILGTLGREFRRIWGTSGVLSHLPRLIGFWALVLGGPALVAASLFSHGGLAGALPRSASSLATGMLAFLLAYLVLPGCLVRPSAALTGAALAALLWEGLKAGFVYYLRHAFVANAMLAGLGLLPALLLWLYASWVVFLLGAELTFVLADPAAARRRAGVEPGAPGMYDP